MTELGDPILTAIEFALKDTLERYKNPKEEDGKIIRGIKKRRNTDTSFAGDGSVLDGNDTRTVHRRTKKEKHGRNDDRRRIRRI